LEFVELVTVGIQVIDGDIDGASSFFVYGPVAWNEKFVAET